MNDPQAITEQFHFDVYNRFPVTITKGKGATVWTDDGRKLLDALAGIAVNTLGHCHPRVVETVQQQVGKLMHISNFYYSEPQAALIQKIAHLTGMDKVFLSNSGAEGTESAIKLARKWAHAQNRSGPILTMTNGFHGRTIATVAMGMEKYSDGFGPLPAGFKQVAFNDVDALHATAEQEPIAIIIETIQGSGGLSVASTEFMSAVQQFCDAHDVLLIIDEVQTGIARTGKMWGYQYYDINPDIVVMAKALGGGFPISAMAARAPVAEAMSYGSHGTTFGGNPLACAASLAALQAIEDEDLVQQAKEKGRWLFERLRKEGENNDAITEVRGRGLMLGVELAFPGRPVVDEMLQRGVLSNCTQGNVIRLVPPVVITEKQLKMLADVLLASIKTVKDQHHANNTAV